MSLSTAAYFPLTVWDCASERSRIPRFLKSEARGRSQSPISNMHAARKLSSYLKGNAAVESFILLGNLRNHSTAAMLVLREPGSVGAGWEGWGGSCLRKNHTVLQERRFSFQFLTLRQTCPFWTFCLIIFFTCTIFPSAFIYILQLFFCAFSVLWVLYFPLLML